MDRDLPSTSTDSESENYRRLGILLLDIGTPLVQEIFRRRRDQFLPKPCTNVSEIASNFSEVLISPSKEGQNAAFSSMSTDQKNTLQGEDISSWDLTFLYNVLTHIDYTNGSPSTSLDHHRENCFIKHLEEIRHNYARSSKRRISHRKFRRWWKRAESALISLGVSELSIKEVKDSNGIVKSFQNFDLPTQNFTGRQDLLHKIHSLFNTCYTKQSFEERIVLLRGVGGIGKSELARMYADTYIEDPIIQNVAWIDAEGLCSLKASFTSLAKRLRLITDGKEIDEIVKNVYEHFSEHIGTGLFIFDNSQSQQQVNLNDKPFGIFKYLPKQYLQRRPLVLITGTERDKQWEISKENILTVDKLTESESVDLLSKKFKLTLTTNENDQQNNCDYQSAIKTLARALQGYPLGLALANSNIDIGEWTDLKVEIQAYLEKIKEPEPKPIDEHQQSELLATNYQLTIEDVFEVTLKKIQALRSVGINSIRVLNIIAFLPPSDLTIDKVKDIFNFSFEKSPFSTKLLHILEKYSLVTVFQGKYKKENEVHRIRIHPLVQRCARDKLDSERDFSYLLGICKYLSHQGLEDNKKDVEIKETLICFHEYLKTRKWPDESILYSVIFCSLVVPSYMDFSAAFVVAQDVYDYLKFESRSEHEMKTKDGMDSDVLNLFLMCLFRIKYSGKYPWHRMFKNPKLSNDKLEKLYLSLLEPAIEQVIVSKSDAIMLPQLHCYKFCFELVFDIITHSKFQKTKRSFKTEIWNIFLGTVNGARGCSLENTYKIYGLQSLCFSHDRRLDCIRCMEIMFKKHFEVYHDLRKTNKNSGKQLKKYWNSEGPLQLFGLIDICELSHAGKKEAILDSFFSNGGVQILVEYISYLCKYDVMDAHPFLFEFISKLAYDLNCDEKFIQDTEFIKVYQKLTKMLAERKHEDSLIYQFFCLTSWFALFARHTHCDCEDTTRGDEFCIDSLTTEFSTMLQNLEQEGPVKYTHWYCIYNDIDILNGFLDKYKNWPKCLAAETADLYIKLIKNICMASLKIQSQKIKKEDKLHTVTDDKEEKEDSEEISY